MKAGGHSLNLINKEYERLIENLRKQTDVEGEYLTGVMPLIPHAAYHLGTIRQQHERVSEYIMKTV
jgi:hypothetical protein